MRAQPARSERGTVNFLLVLGSFLPVRAGLRFPSQFPSHWAGRDQPARGMLLPPGTSQLLFFQSVNWEGDSGTVLSCVPPSCVMGSSAEHGAGTGRESGRDARRGWLGCAGVSRPSRSPLKAKEKPGLMSMTMVSHQLEEQPARECRPTPCSPHGTARSAADGPSAGGRL